MLGVAIARRTKLAMDRARLARAIRRRERNRDMTEELRLSSPWVTFHHALVALFAEDPDVRIECGEGDDDVSIRVYVEGVAKADALSKLLPTERTFGNVTVPVTVIPANDEPTTEELFRTAFEGNPALSYCATVDGVMTNPITYVVFRNCVVQYWNDNLGDINGNVSTLYQDIAKDVLSEAPSGALFCTDLPDAE